MTPREGAGWQITLADLSLILFAIMAAATARSEGPPGEAAHPSVPVAVARDGDVDHWLDQQPRDPRQRLTITASYAPGRLDAAIAGARRLAGHAYHSDSAPRIIIQPGTTDGLAASLAFDQSGRNPS